MTQQKSVIDWLKDAHAMEAGGVTTLSDHAAAAREYPEVQAKLGAHAQATRRHAERLEERLERLGESPSSLKEAVGAAFSKVAGVANLPASDTVVKNALGDFAAENFEIASYRSLIAAAEAVGDHDTASVCGQILREEETMAGWLGEQIPAITRQFLTGQAGIEGNGVLSKAKETARNLGEQAKAAAPDAGGTRNALLATGALLAGAGAALLISRAVRGGSAERQDQPDKSHSAHLTPEAQRYGDGASAEHGLNASAVGHPVSPGHPVSDLEESARAVAPADFLNSPDALTNAVESQDELVIETASGAAGVLLSSQPQTTGTDGASAPAEPATTPALHDGSQAEITPSEDAGTSEVEIWLVPGPFSGLGPLAYDSAGDPLGEAVASRLTQHGHVDATHVEIVIDNGEVLLEGTVDSETTRRLAEGAVQQVAGVSRVQNLLQVRPGEGI